MGTILIYGAMPKRLNFEQNHDGITQTPLCIELDENNDSRTLAQIIWTDGRIAPPPLCSGLGRCGRCRVQFVAPESAPQPDAPQPDVSEAQILGPEAIAQGWRLACRHKGPEGDAKWNIVVPHYVKKTKHIELTVKASSQPCLLAVDLGTTSLHWEAILPSGETVATASVLNPQMGAGSDIMSRIAYAMTETGRQTLRRLLIDKLCEIQAELIAQGFYITELCIAGNTAMTAIVADISVESLASAPYAVPHAGNDYVDLTPEAVQGSSNYVPQAWLPPQVAPFIGGDISAGYVALCQDYAPRYPFLLTDLGTNGEFVLALSPEKSIVTSVPLGPALEGIGLRHGAVAAPGVITKFSLGPMGLVATCLPNTDGSQAKAHNAISGTGYLSLISTLLRAGILDEKGSFVQSASGSSAGVPLSPLAMRMVKTLYRVASQNDLVTQDAQHSGELRLPLTPSRSFLPQGRGFSAQQARFHAPNMMNTTACSIDAQLAQQTCQSAELFDLSGSDIEEILKVKAAFSLAVAALLKVAELPANALDRIYIAGALGLHIMPHDLEGLGFLPTGSEKRIIAVGNTSLKGAKAFLLSHEQRLQAQHWASTCAILDLTQNHEDFTQSFLRHMMFRF